MMNCPAPVLQICLLQHWQNSVFPHKGCKRTPGSSPAWTNVTTFWLDSQPLAAYPERLSTIILPCDPPPPLPLLASCCDPHPLQDDGASLQGHQQNCTYLASNTSQTTRPTASAGQLVPPSLRANKACSAKP